jgi:hypothetical protein
LPNFKLPVKLDRSILYRLNARQKMRMALNSQQRSLDKKEPGIRGIGRSTRHVPPFQVEVGSFHKLFHHLSSLFLYQSRGHTSSHSEDAPGFTYTIDRVTDHDDGDVELGRAQA